MHSDQPITLRHYLAFALLCAIWGSTWMAIRVVVREVPPFWAAGVRFVIAAIILLVVALVRRLKLPATGAQWRALVILGVTIMAVPFGLLFWAEQYVTSSMTAVLYASSPLMISLLTPLMTGKSVPRIAVFSMLVAVGGIAVLFQLQLTATPRQLLGGIAILLSVLSTAWSIHFAKRETLDVAPVVSTGIQLAVGAVFLLAASALVEKGQGFQWSRAAWIGILFLATFGSAVAFAVYYWLLRHVHPYKLSTLTLIVPLVAIVEGALILQEAIPPMMLGAALMVLVAVGVVLKAQADTPTELKLAE